MPTFIAFTDNDLDHGPSFDAPTVSDAITHARTMTTNRPIRLYRQNAPGDARIATIGADGVAFNREAATHTLFVVVGDDRQEHDATPIVAVSDDDAARIADMMHPGPGRVTVYDAAPGQGGFVCYEIRRDAAPTVETTPTVETPPTDAAPRTTRKICRRDGCGVDAPHRYYVHTAPGVRSLWCGGCVRTHATTITTERWAIAATVIDTRGRRQRPSVVGVWATCDECGRPGDRDHMGVLCTRDSTLRTICRTCVSDVDDGHVRSVQSDPYDTVRPHRWIDDRHPDAVRVTVSRYGDTHWTIRGPHVRVCPGCACDVDTRHVPFRAIGLDVAGGIGPGEVEVCTRCVDRTTTDDDDVEGYHHTTAVHPVRVTRAGDVVRDDTRGPMDRHVVGDPGYGGRPIVLARDWSGYRPPPRRAPILMGVEWEIAATDTTTPGQIARYCRETWGALFAEAKSDSSIGPGRARFRGGVEVVTHPGTIGAFRGVFSTWKAPIGAEANTTTGMHVHVSRDALTPGQIDRICYLMSRRADASAWSAVFRRPPNHYCQTYSPGSFSRRRWREEAAKYRVVNITPRHTIEFRWPASTARGDVLLATVEIVHAICLYTSPGNPGGSHTASALSWSAFARWITSDPWALSETRHARRYLAARGLIAARKARPGVTVWHDDGTDDTIRPDMLAPLVSGSEWSRLRAAA